VKGSKKEGKGVKRAAREVTTARIDILSPCVSCFDWYRGVHTCCSLSELCASGRFLFGQITMVNCEDFGISSATWNDAKCARMT
jgi:hypothetical protein